MLRKVTLLNLCHNERIGDRGLRAVARMVRDGSLPVLEKIYVTPEIGMTQDGLNDLDDACQAHGIIHCQIWRDKRTMDVVGQRPDVGHADRPSGRITPPPAEMEKTPPAPPHKPITKPVHKPVAKRVLRLECSAAAPPPALPVAQV